MEKRYTITVSWEVQFGYRLNIWESGKRLFHCYFGDFQEAVNKANSLALIIQDCKIQTDTEEENGIVEDEQI